MRLNCNFQRGGEEFIPKKTLSKERLGSLLNSGRTHINKITSIEQLHQKLFSFICIDLQNKEKIQAVDVLSVQERKIYVLIKRTKQIALCILYLICCPVEGSSAIYITSTNLLHIKNSY